MTYSSVQPPENAQIPTHSPQAEFQRNREASEFIRVENIALQGNNGTCCISPPSQSLDQFDRLSFLPACSQGIDTNQNSQETFPHSRTTQIQISFGRTSLTLFNQRGGQGQ